MSQIEVEARLQELAERQVSRGRVFNTVLAIQSADRRVDAVAVAGYADAGRTIAMTSDTVYLLASIAKLYTVTVLAQLVESKELDLASPVAEYLGPDVVTGIHVYNGTDHSNQITVGQLANQTSGLADYFDGKPQGGSSLLDELAAGKDRSLTLADKLDIVRRLQPGFAPGTSRKAQYSDTNYALLGAIMESVTGASVSRNFERRIFGPLGLTATYPLDQIEGRSAPATVFLKEQPVELPLFLSSHVPEGGLAATVTDSLRFLRSFFGGELFSPARLAEMTAHFKPIFFPLRYACGVMLYQVPRWMAPFGSPRLVGHSGSTGSFAFYEEARDLFVAGTVNQMDNPARPYRLLSSMFRLAR
ncbi:MAG: serine hydrolase domain-containing protein [Acidimicrobiia bacterium]